MPLTVRPPAPPSDSARPLVCSRGERKLSPDEHTSRCRWSWSGLRALDVDALGLRIRQCGRTLFSCELQRTDDLSRSAHRRAERSSLPPRRWRFRAGLQLRAGLRRLVRPGVSAVLCDVPTLTLLGCVRNSSGLLGVLHTGGRATESRSVAVLSHQGDGNTCIDIVVPLHRRKNNPRNEN